MRRGGARRSRARGLPCARPWWFLGMSVGARCSSGGRKPPPRGATRRAGGGNGQGKRLFADPATCRTRSLAGLVCSARVLAGAAGRKYGLRRGWWWCSRGLGWLLACCLSRTRASRGGEPFQGLASPPAPSPPLHRLLHLSPAIAHTHNTRLGAVTPPSQPDPTNHQPTMFVRATRPLTTRTTAGATRTSRARSVVVRAGTFWLGTRAQAA